MVYSFVSNRALWCVIIDHEKTLPPFSGSIINRARAPSINALTLSVVQLKISEINHALSPNTCTIKDEISFLSIQHFYFIPRASAQVEGAEQLSKDLIFFFRRALKTADRRVCATWYSSRYVAAASSSPDPTFWSLSRKCDSFGWHSRNSETCFSRSERLDPQASLYFHLNHVVRTKIICKNKRNLAEVMSRNLGKTEWVMSTN